MVRWIITGINGCSTKVLRWDNGYRVAGFLRTIDGDADA
jgi:hypothetical protein